VAGRKQQPDLNQEGREMHHQRRVNLIKRSKSTREQVKAILVHQQPPCTTKQTFEALLKKLESLASSTILASSFC